MRIYNNVIETIGNTPLVRINKMIGVPGVTVLAKLEGGNPSGSVKDRIALKMLNQAEEGALRPGKTIIEATSGNTGIAIALIGGLKGYEVEIVMSESVSIERRKVLKAYGAKVILTPANEGTDGAIREVRKRVAAEPDRYFSPDQFTNKYNKLAHYATTAEEILKDTDNRVTHYVSAIGTSGTLMGVGKRLKEYNSDIRIVAAEPELHHRIQGLKNMKEAIVPEIYDPGQIDEHIIIATEDAYEMARRLAKEDGIFYGMSSGAAMVAAREVAKHAQAGSVIVVLLADRGEKNLSTELYAQ